MESLEGENVMNLDKFHIDFRGDFGNLKVTPRGLRWADVDRLVNVKGIVDSVSKVKPGLLKSVHYCEADNTDLVKEHHDNCCLITEKKTPFQNNVIPTKKIKNHVLTMDWGLWEYKDIQKVQMQGMAENFQSGMLSRSVEAVGVLKTKVVGKSFSGGVFPSFLPVTGVISSSR